MQLWPVWVAEMSSNEQLKIYIILIDSVLNLLLVSDVSRNTWLIIKIKVENQVDGNFSSSKFAPSNGNLWEWLKGSF